MKRKIILVAIVAVLIGVILFLVFSDGSNNDGVKNSDEYADAVKNGYSGTIEEWIAALVGETVPEEYVYDYCLLNATKFYKGCECEASYKYDTKGSDCEYGIDYTSEYCETTGTLPETSSYISGDKYYKACLVARPCSSTDNYVVCSDRTKTPHGDSCIEGSNTKYAECINNNIICELNKSAYSTYVTCDIGEKGIGGQCTSVPTEQSEPTFTKYEKCVATSEICTRSDVKTCSSGQTGLGECYKESSTTKYYAYCVASNTVCTDRQLETYTADGCSENSGGACVILSKNATGEQILQYYCPRDDED